MGNGRTERRLAGLALACSAALLTGCGVIEDTVEGMTGSSPDLSTPAPGRSSEAPGPAGDEIVVTVEIDSDATTIGDVEIVINSPSSPQSFHEETVEVPFTREFTVATDVAFPLRGTTVEAHASPGATYVTCSIAVDGEIVTTHRSEGSRATAICERKLQLGPS